VAMSKNIKWALGIVAALIVIAALVVYPKLVVTLPNDGADAKPFTFKGVRGHRYTEMFLIGGNGSRLKLPPGWKFRAPVLEQDLVLTPDKDGIAHITQDDFGNTYDRVGGPYSNYKP